VALALPLGGFGAALALGLGSRPLIERRIPAKRETMTTWCVIHTSASDTAAKPPSTTNTSRGPGNQRRPCLIICRTQSMMVLCRRWGLFSAGRHRAVSNGNAHTRRLQGTATNSIIDPHFKPKQQLTCFWVERTASR